MRQSITVIHLLAAMLLAAALPVRALENITVGTTTRTMITYAPDGLPSQPALVIACHGASQDAAYLQSLSKWESVADTAKFVIVYANGLNNMWDISGTSDLQFMEAIIDTMYSRHHIDRNRVYLTGFSMGGMFTYYAASKMADKIAAFAPVSGYLMGGPNATASRPVPILHTHGTADDVCVYSNVQSHINAWVTFNGCETTPVVVQPYPAYKPNSPAKLERYLNGRNGVEVALLTLADKGHWWSMDDSQALTSVEVWNFCQRYSLGDPEPEITSIEPENMSFDLLPEAHNTFTVQFSDSIDAALVTATLTDETVSITLDKSVPDGYTPDVTFSLPRGCDIPDGEYTLTIANARTAGGGVLPRATFTYAYGVVEVGETWAVDTLFCPDWYAEQATIGEGIPDGWRRVNTTSDGTKETTHGGTANCGGVRMKYFAPGGDFDAGFYLSARDNASCLLRYGSYAASRLSLDAGRYRLSFRSTYWSEGAQSAGASFNFRLGDISGATHFSAPSLRPVGTMSERTDRAVTTSQMHSFDLSLAAADYVLDFEMAEGWNSIIFGSLLITTCPSLADTYKGTFHRLMLKARRAAAAYPYAAATVTLQATIRKYADFHSTSPTAYTTAIKDVAAAIAAFEAADKSEATSIATVPTVTDAPLMIYSPTGIQRQQCAPGLNIVITSDKKVQKIFVQ